MTVYTDKNDLTVHIALKGNLGPFDKGVAHLIVQLQHGAQLRLSAYLRG